MFFYVKKLIDIIKNLWFFFKFVCSEHIKSLQNKYNVFSSAIRKFILKVLSSFTLAKLLSAIITCTIAALCKYLYSGGFYIEWNDFSGNFSIGIISWICNTYFKDYFLFYLNTKGFNFNLHQLLFGLKTHKMGDDIPLSEFKPKLYNSMDMDIDDDDNSNKPVDKGKGVDTESHPNYYGGNNAEETESSNSDNKPLDKGKGIDRNAHPFYEGFKPKEETPVTPQATEPPFSIWRKLNPGKDPAEVFFPKKINPGPGFNVPGGEVPIRDEICQHIDYNSHILNQFKKMDLETAIQQRNNYLKYVETINNKLNYAQNVLSKLPEVPNTDYEYRLKAKIMSDLEGLNRAKIRSEARATLLLSRIEFIQIEVNKKN